MTIERHTELERVLADATALLLEHTRQELEREADRSGSGEAATELARLHDVAERLAQVRRLLADESAAARAGRQVSRYYEAPGQEDN